MRVVTSKFDGTSSIGTVIVYDYRIPIFMVFRVIVWPYDR